jgi:hypothetical protein
MSEILNSIVLLFILVAVYFCTQKKKEDFINMNKLPAILPATGLFNDNYNSPILGEFTEASPLQKSEEIKFNYSVRPVDKEFLKEQDNGVNLNTWYSNTYIKKLDKDGKPIWGSREQQTGVKDTFIQEHTRMTYEFNEPKSINMDGPIDPSAAGTKISDVFDNYFVNYKKLTPNKELVVEEIDSKKTNGASNLDFFAPDTWVYNDEKPENGGMIKDGLYAADMNNLNPIATF